MNDLDRTVLLVYLSGDPCSPNDMNNYLPCSVSQAAYDMRLLNGCICTTTISAGYNPNNIDKGRLPFYLTYTPAGTSVQNMAHW